MASWFLAHWLRRGGLRKWVGVQMTWLCLLSPTMALPWTGTLSWEPLPLSLPGLLYCEGLSPILPPYALALLTPAALCCSNIQLCPFNLESSPKLTTMISKQFPSPLHTMHGYVDNVCDCCKNDGVKIGSPTKKKKEIKTYLNKLKQFRPNLRLPRLEPNIGAVSLWPP